MNPEPKQQNQAAVPKTIKAQLSSDYFRQQIALLIPKHMTAERFTRIALTSLTRTPDLANCTWESILKAMMTCSELGLEPDGRRFHLIPFMNRKLGAFECQGIVDYKGLVELCRNNGDVSMIHADVVCDKDNFVYANGEVNHVIDFRQERGLMFAAYVIVTFKDGSKHSEVMTKSDIDRIRKRSKAGDNGPWVTDYNEMAKKGLAIDTPIPTPDGWAEMGSLKTGDIVFDMHGQPTKVIGVSEVKRIECFRVKFTNGDSIVCDNEHRWVARAGTSNANKMPFGIFTVNELADAIQFGKSVTIPMQHPLALPERELSIDPYLFGYWLGDGHCTSAQITCGAKDLDHLIKVIRASKYELGTCRKDKRSTAYTVGIKRGFLSDLRATGVLGNKHVPKAFLRSSIHQRAALLAGLMDSDGHLDIARGRAHFYNTNKQISDAVAELVISLGDVPHISEKQMNGFGTSCTGHFVGWKPTECCLLNPRKAANYKPRLIKSYRAISSIDRIQTVATQCIAVDSPTHTYLAGRSMAPTHNTVFRRATKWIKLSPEIHDVLDRESEPVQLVGEVAQRAAPITVQTQEEPEDNLTMGEPGAARQLEPPQPDPVYTDAEKAEAQRHAAKLQSETRVNVETKSANVETNAAKPGTIHTIQETLSEHVIGAGFTFDDFRRWGEEIGAVPNAMSLGDWSEVPNDVSKRLLRGATIQSVLKGIAEMKGKLV